MDRLSRPAMSAERRMRANRCTPARIRRPDGGCLPGIRHGRVVHPEGVGGCRTMRLTTR
ncbi:hypothetical protein WAT24_10460 [Fulvimonas yonginensis]|uniref:Uncharacterized protein n=1 Tax=Fulvimonas yonginensis TaxID=1495200 RepID=A0ABU8JD28_9GAMM